MPNHERIVLTGPLAGFAAGLEDALGLLGDFAVIGGQHAVEIFDHGDLGAEAVPDRTQLQADYAGTDHHQVRRHFRKGQGFGTCADQVAIDFDTFQGSGSAAGGNDNLAGIQLYRLRTFDNHLSHGRDPATT